MSSPLFRKKPISTVLHDQPDGAHGQAALRKVLGVKDLTAMGIAAVIGAGIFSTIGQAAYDGGPGVVFLCLPRSLHHRTLLCGICVTRARCGSA